MRYLSQLIGASVDDEHKAHLGKLIDILTLEEQVGREEATYPTVLLIEDENEIIWRVPPAAITLRDDDDLRLQLPISELTRQPTNPSEEEVSLADEVLDKQVIDFARKKAIRVNDVCFADDWQILGIDNSTFGLARRLAPSWLLGAFSRHATPLIPWERIELIRSQYQESDEPTHTSESEVKRIPSGHLAELHPADIAEIVHQLTPGQGARLIESLDDEMAADTMEEVDTERQSLILENIQAERAADILQAMGPDEAADLISQLPQERAIELLRLMTPEESEDVQELLEYEPDSAGGLMTTDYIVLNQTRTVAEALDSVRINARDKDVRLAYIYCVEDETQEDTQVLGVVSLWDLLISPSELPLQDLMETHIISVAPDAEPRAVAEIIAKYNLLAVPVITPDGFLAGVVTVDDAIDILLPPERRRKPQRMY